MSNDNQLFSSYRTPIKEIQINDTTDSFLECLDEIKPAQVKEPILSIVGDIRK